MPEELRMSRYPEAYPFADTDRQNVSNPYRYIAHAGGAYDGKTYTNSLEALNYSYSNSFKLFELDLILTRDNQIVAAHDWDMWKEYSGFAGELPPTVEEFNNLPTYETLTSLSMEDIIAWFDAHHDAILVTDKITDFKKLSAEFPYPERLIVEVFTLNDYILAHEEGIRYPLLSLEATSSGPDGEWLLNFIIVNKVPMAVLNIVSTEVYHDELTAINKNGGYIFANTSNEIEYLPSHPELFGVYTDTINFTTMTVGPISNDALHLTNQN